MLRRFTVTMLSILFLIATPISVTAESNEGLEPEMSASTWYASETEKEYQFLKGIEKIEKNILKGPQYHYRMENLASEWEEISGIPGGQPPGGVQFNSPDGGEIFYIESGGPSIPVSLSVSLPEPYNFVSFTVDLGQKSNGMTIYSLHITDPDHYYKMGVIKRYEIKKYIVYRAPAGTEDWEFDHAGAVPVFYRLKLYPIRVN